MINGQQRTRNPVTLIEPGAHRYGYTRYTRRQLAFLAISSMAIVVMMGVITENVLVSLGTLLGLSLGWIFGLAG